MTCGTCGLPVPPALPVLPHPVTLPVCGCGDTGVVYDPYPITRGLRIHRGGLDYYQIGNPWEHLLGGPRLLFVDPRSGECFSSLGRPGLGGPRPYLPSLLG
jgi:hypothetical protein